MLHARACHGICVTAAVWVGNFMLAFIAHTIKLPVTRSAIAAEREARMRASVSVHPCRRSWPATRPAPLLLQRHRRQPFAVHRQLAHTTVTSHTKRDSGTRQRTRIKQLPGHAHLSGSSTRRAARRACTTQLCLDSCVRHPSVHLIDHPTTNNSSPPTLCSPGSN